MRLSSHNEFRGSEDQVVCSQKFAALQDVAHAVLLEEGFFLLHEDASNHLVRMNVRLYN